MSRDLGALGGEIVKPVFNPFYALAIGLPEAVRAWTGIGTLRFGGYDYDGTGAFGSIGEGTDGSAIGMTATLSGISPDLVDDIFNQPYRGASFQLFIGATADDFKTISAEPVLLWRGKVDAVTVADGEQLAVTITAESRMRDQGRPRVRRYTNQEQQQRHPGDRMFEYLPSLAEINMVWGKA